MRLLVGVAVLCLVAAGCGGVESEPNLAQAIERTEAQGSGRIDVVGNQKTNHELVQFDCTGEADYSARRVHVSCDYDDLGRIEAIAIGKDFYLRNHWPAGFASEDKWLKQTGEVDEDTSLANLSPQRLLALLKKASTEIERIGEEDVRGVATVRYRLTVECGSAVLDCEGSAPVDVWIADDGIVRRISLHDDVGGATFEFYDFGVDVDIEPPPADQVAEGDLLVPGQSTIETSQGVECATGEARPIRQGQAVATLRRHGFSMVDDGQSCMVTNAAGNGGDVLEREGIVFCSVHAEPPAGAPKTVVRRSTEGADAELALENLECTIFTDSPTGEEKIDRLEAAFDELEQAIHP
jgi:hypothetical protein